MVKNLDEEDYSVRCYSCRIYQQIIKKKVREERKYKINPLSLLQSNNEGGVDGLGYIISH